MVGFFWRKLLIFNIGILIIVFRIYGGVFNHLYKKILFDSVFPRESQDGYPFFDSINCNMQSLVKIVTDDYDNIKEKLLKKQSFNDIEQVLGKQKFECSKFNLYKISQNEKNLQKLMCPEPLKKDEIFKYHNYFTIKNDKKEIQSLDESEVMSNDLIFGLLNSENYINNKEMIFLHSIISGYDSYLKILDYKVNIKNYEYLRKTLTQFEYKLNDLFFLHSLLIQSALKLDKFKFNVKVTEEFIKMYASQCIDISDEKFMDVIRSNEIKQKVLSIFANMKSMLSCIEKNNKKFSFLLDFNALETMIKLIVNDDININDNEKTNLLNFYDKVTVSIQDIFRANLEIKELSDKYQSNQTTLFAIYWVIAVISLILANKYFIKHKEFYSGRSRMFGKRNHYDFAKLKKYQESIQKIKERSSKENNEKYNNKGLEKYSPEELEYIEKLTKNSGKNNEFVVTK